MNPITQTSVTYWVNIFIAGERADIEHACRIFCLKGLCVTVTPTNYIFTGGSETGCIVGLINYPRFPSTSEKIWDNAKELASFLLCSTYQRSCTIMAPDRSEYLTNNDIIIPR